MPTRAHALVTITLLSLIAIIVASVHNGLTPMTGLLWLTWVATALVTTQVALRGRHD
ncbi:hypothetical protein [Nocardiopsis sp. MG754419]|uniref:hypothetical protein n=1 Tax=Nocardiopsis sp. MG754419 TaxID=2259865 RepID=UPI001BA9F822|nr:hypothetical protein [Nocardiopsis sp. MG754419]